jgi:poly(hydroxyalkanoate) depolymerase family esterase
MSRNVTALPDEQSIRHETPPAAQQHPRLAWDGPFLFVSKFGKRPYYVYTPASYKVGTCVPLVVMLHGCSQTPRGSAVPTQWNDLAEESDFIVVYPGQTIEIASDKITGQVEEPAEALPHECWRDGNVDNCWNWYLPRHQERGTGEPAIIAGIARAVRDDTTRWTIDSSRVYVAGMSAGGAMAVILGATYPDLFRAVGAHSGFEYKAATCLLGAGEVLGQGGPGPIGQCRQAFQAMGKHARLVPVIVIHGTEDRRVNPVNGDQVVRQWLETNRLASGDIFKGEFNKPATDERYNEAVPGGHPYRIRKWKDNSGKVIQEYLTIEGLAHAWSGGYWLGSFADPRGPSATRAMYSFFSHL